MSIASETRKRLTQLESMLEAMTTTLEQAQESYDSKSAKWQDSDKGQFVYEQISNFESALGEVQSAFDNLQGIQLEFEGA